MKHVGLAMGALAVSLAVAARGFRDWRPDDDFVRRAVRKLEQISGTNAFDDAGWMNNADKK